MNEYDDLISDGYMCAWCGKFFKESHGHLVACKDCCKGKSSDQLEKAGVRRSVYNEL